MNELGKLCLWVMAAAAVSAPGLVQAQYGDGGSGGAATPAGSGAARNVVNESNSPLRDGSYVSLMGTYQMTENDPVLTEMYGATLLLGYRNGFYGFESGIAYTVDSDVDRQSFKLRGLFFPFESWPLYALVGGGMTRYTQYPIERTQLAIAGGDDFVTADLAAGIGYQLPLKMGNYEFALRAEGLYEVGDRFLERENDFEEDIRAPGTFKDVVVNLGLLLPLRKPLPPPPPPAPAAVVEPVPPVDSDGDGVVDDMDHCPDTPYGVEVDSHGCELPPPPPPCKTPEAGERISLDGCGTGDVIVLRGVNFEFDRSALTVNARTLLDEVAEELQSHPGFDIEIAGHTDNRGSDDYNLSLSAERAKSVMAYLVDGGVDANRLTARGYGESEPVADNQTDEGRELNRRVELKIVGGAPETQRRPPANDLLESDLDADDAAPPANDEEPVEPDQVMEPQALEEPVGNQAPAGDLSDLDGLFDF